MERSSSFRKILGLLPALAVMFGAGFRLRGEGHFSAPTYNLVTSTITASGQTAAGSAVITVPHDTPCTLRISVPQIGDETLKNGPASLGTTYKITGSGVTNPDSGWVSAAQFITQTYALPGANNTDLTLHVHGATPPSAAPDAGAYTATLIFTVSW